MQNHISVLARMSHIRHIVFQWIVIVDSTALHALVTQSDHRHEKIYITFIPVLESLVEAATAHSALSL